MTATALSFSGGLFLPAAWGFIIVVTMFCFKRVLGTQNQKQR
jgi:hypothetical protein